MPKPGTAEPYANGGGWIDSLTLPRLLILLALVSFVLRIFYTGYLFEDDGLWFTAAEQILKGKALYREIYFDKPPVLPLVYALLFKMFGAHIIVIRLFTVVFATTVSGLLYLFGSSLYDRKTGILAAALFAFFSTTGVSGHVQGLNSDFLMALPYTLGAYLFTLSYRASIAGSRRILLALAGGAITGIAVQTNPKGIFNLAFFAVLLGSEILAYNGQRRSRVAQDRLRPRAAIRLLALAAGGVLLGSLPFLAYLASTHSVSDYIRFVWGWGLRYAGYFPLAQSLTTGARVVFSYLALNSVLTIALVFFLARIAKKLKGGRDGQGQAVRESGSGAPTSILPTRALEQAPPIPSLDVHSAVPTGSLAQIAQTPTEGQVERSLQNAKAGSLEPDSILFIWLVCCFAAMTLGGRFYAHYFFEILPAACLAGARGLIYIKHWVVPSAAPLRRRHARRIIVWVLALGFLITLVRFHTRTAVLAMDWARSSKSDSTARWFHEILNREERMAAGLVSELPGGPEQAMMLSPEAIRALHRAPAGMPGPSDYLFVWGYRPEVYYWSGLIPASRFISIQPVTGVPADVQYINGNARSVLPESAKQCALDQLLKDLEDTRPRYIVDEAGMFNSALGINSYPGIGDFMRAYRQVQATGRLMIYRRRDPSKKNRLSNPQ